jgi:hypothetical protein
MRSAPGEVPRAPQECVEAVKCGQLSAKALLLTMLRRHYQGLSHLKRGDLWRWIKRAA